MIRPNFTYVIPIEVFKSNLRVAADSLPSAVLYRTGAATMVEVVVTSTSETGVYHATFTTPSNWEVTDRIWLDVAATIDGSDYKKIVWRSENESATPQSISDQISSDIDGSLLDWPQAIDTAGSQAGDAISASVWSKILSAGVDTEDVLRWLSQMIEDASGRRFTAKAVENTLQANDVDFGSVLERLPESGRALAAADYATPLDATQTQAAAAAAITAADVATKTKQDETIDLIKAGELDQDVKVV